MPGKTSEDVKRKGRILLTGADGFVGRNALGYLKGIPLTDRDGGWVDIRDADYLQKVVAGLKPDSVIHLAAQTFVPDSFKNPKATFEINFLGTLNLLEALKGSDFTGRMLFVGSGDIYGTVPAERMPIIEEFSLKPRSPYAVSKVAAEALCYQWSQTEKFAVVMARPFNHIGPGQSEHFVVSNFAKQIIEIKTGLRDPILRVGDIDVTRDFTDVRDIVAAYGLLLEHGKNGEVYNICSGREYSIREILKHMMKIAGVEAKVEQDKERLRSSEQRRIFGSFEKLRRDTGWLPKMTIEQTLQDVLDDWSKRIP